MTQFRLTVDRTGDIPWLMIAPEENTERAPLALVLHGLGSYKEKVLPSVYAFASAGFRALAIDVRLHGERTGAGERDSRMGAAYLETMYEMITGTSRDITLILDRFGADRAAIHGISLGGYISFAALVSEPRLVVASVAMGSPDWLAPLRALGIALDTPLIASLASANPLDRAEDSYPPRPLLMLHGDEDDVVSIDGVRMLEERLRPAYSSMPERLQLVTYPGLGHQYTEDMIRRSVQWSARYL